MELIDDEGRLFGVVNVIDALVVLLVLAVVVGGIALVDPFDSSAPETESKTEPEPATRYATLDLGEQPSTVAEEIAAGESGRLANASNATVTDVYVGPADGGDVAVVARVRINGTLSEDGSFSVSDEYVRPGGEYTLDAPAYTANATVTRLDTEGQELDTVTRQIRLSGDISEAAAQRLQSGDAATYAGRTGATVEDVHVGPGGDATSGHVTATIEIEALRQSGELLFGNRPVELDQSLSFDFGEYGLSGQIDAIGDDTQIETDSTTVTLATTLPEDVATRLQTGDTYEFGPETVATIETIHQQPGPSDDQRRVYFGLSLGTVVQDGDRYFGSNRLSIGESIPFRTSGYGFSGTISALDRTVEMNSTRVRLEGDVSATTAERIESGQTVSIGGTDIAAIEDIYIGPGSDGSSRRFVAAVSLETVRQPDRLVFGGQAVALGRSISLDFGEYDLSGRVDAIGDDTQIETNTTSVSAVTTVSADVAKQLQTGDTYELESGVVATIESSHQYPDPSDDQRRVYLGLGLETVTQGGELYFGSDQLTVGQSIPFRTDEYSFTSTVDAFGAGVETNTTQVAVETTVSNTVANAIEVGDTFDIANRSIASVQTVDVYPTGDDTTRRVLLGLDLQTVARDSGAYFGNDRVALGTTVPFETEAYSLSGTVLGRGSYAPDGNTTTETITVTVEDVDPDFADGIEVGMVEESMGQTTAEILDKQTEPASTILTSDDGQIYERTHPRNEDVTLTVEVTARETSDGYQFHAKSLREGDEITLDFRTITVRGTVTDI